jgi:hypothetical protein
VAPSNIEVVQAMYERRERGDMDVAEFVDPEIQFARIGSTSLTSPASGTAWTACVRPRSST